MPPGTLRRVALARMVDEDPPHELRRHAEELRAIEPRHALLAHQADVGLVHERRRLQCVIAALAPQVGGGPLSKLLIDEGHQILSRLQVPAPPRLEQLTDRPDVWSPSGSTSPDVAPEYTAISRRDYRRRLRCHTATAAGGAEK